MLIIAKEKLFLTANRKTEKEQEIESKIYKLKVKVKGKKTNRNSDKTIKCL